MNVTKKIDGDGMIHGRFQPFTLGHMQHLKRALKRVKKGNKLYIGITKPFPTDNGISLGDDHRDSKNSNPYTFEQRKAMILTSIEMDSSIADRIEDIIIIPWPMNNLADLDRVINFYMPDRKVTQFMNLIPGDDWEKEKEKIFHSKGFKTIDLVEPSNPRITSATEVRKRYSKNLPSWTELVPEGTKDILLKKEQNKLFLDHLLSIDDFFKQDERKK